MEACIKKELDFKKGSSVRSSVICVFGVSIALLSLIKMSILRGE